MNAIVVYESMWGNTEAVARAVAEGLGEGTAVAEVADAPTDVTDVHLLVLGGPTHAFSMSRPTTRHDAVEQGAPAANVERGIREWLDTVSGTDGVPGVEVATFDTRVAKARHLPGSAAKKAAKKVRHRRLGHLIDTESFYVEDVAGPLLEGELARARDWGVRLATGPWSIETSGTVRP